MVCNESMLLYGMLARVKLYSKHHRPKGAQKHKEIKMKITTKSNKTVEELVEGIIAANDANIVYINDDGNGSAGPSSADMDTLQEMLDDSELADFSIVEDAELAERIIRDTLEAHDADLDDGTTWILAASEPDQTESNPYIQYLIIWDVDA